MGWEHGSNVAWLKSSRALVLASEIVVVSSHVLQTSERCLALQVAPSVPCTLLTPIAPHSLSFRQALAPYRKLYQQLPCTSKSTL